MNYIEKIPYIDKEGKYVWSPKEQHTIPEQIARLEASVWCRLGPSKIHGIGVIAIRDIAKGTALYPKDSYTYELAPHIMQLHNLHPAIQGIIMDRRQMSNYYRFPNPNMDADMQCFMNHSKTPNSNGHIALIDIKAGEEVTEDYTSFGGISQHHQKCV